MTTGALSWTSSSRTDVGCVRSVNEDACLERPETGLWVVADGMGGYTAGDMASALIVDTLGGIETGPRLSDTVEAIDTHLIDINQKLRDFAEQRGSATVGSTVASLVAQGRHAVCLWAGDSRVYRFRDGELARVSQDHALVEELVEKGVISRRQAADHPQANLVTRAVGAAAELFLDIEIVDLQAGDVFVLCSDGLDREVDDAEIAIAIEAHSSGSLSDTLVELALSRGSRDNVTVVSVHIDHTLSEQANDEEDTVPGAAGM